MGKRGGAKRAPNASSGAHKPLSLREEKLGKKQTQTTNIKSKLKLEHLQNLAVWASGKTSVPSLAAFFGHRLAAENESLGLQPDPSLFSCERCETILEAGFNCTIRIEKNQAKARRKHKKSKISAQNNVVYKCYFCSHRNLRRGTPQGHMKDIYPRKPKPSLKQELAESTLQKFVCLEKDTRSKDEVIKVDDIALPAIAEDSPISNSPVTPTLRTRITLEVKQRKRNRSGTKKPAESEIISATSNAERTVSASTKKRRTSWTSLKEIAERSEQDNRLKIQELHFLFFPRVRRDKLVSYAAPSGALCSRCKNMLIGIITTGGLFSLYA